VRTIAANVLALVLAAGCAQPAARRETIVPAGSIAVFPPLNRTGDSLLVSGASALEKYALRSDRVTAEDVLASEARLVLSRAGFAVVSPELVEAVAKDRPPASASQAAALAREKGIEAAVLYMEVFRWELDAPFHPAYVIAGVEAALVDPKTGGVLWTARRAARPAATPGVVVPGDAHVSAARRVASELLGSLKPAAPEGASPPAAGAGSPPAPGPAAAPSPLPGNRAAGAGGPDPPPAL
jgi:hypothetical protein